MTTKCRNLNQLIILGTPGSWTPKSLFLTNFFYQIGFEIVYRQNESEYNICLIRQFILIENMV